MKHLLLAEQIKLYRRPVSWIMVAFLIMLLFVSAWINYSKNEISSRELWENKVINEIENLEQELFIAPEDAKKYIISQINYNSYLLEYGVNPDKINLYKFLNLISVLLPFLTLFSLIVASDSVASEYKWNTMKLLLIRPANRYQILAAKYLSSLIFAFTLLVMMIVLGVLLGALLFGVQGADETYIFSKDGLHYESMPLIRYLSITYGYKFFTLIIIVSMAFFISVLSRSNTYAVTISVVVLFGGQLITTFLNRYYPECSKYFLFSNLNLSMYYTGTPIFEEGNILFSIGVLTVYLIFFYSLSLFIFVRREVH